MHVHYLRNGRTSDWLRKLATTKSRHTVIVLLSLIVWHYTLYVHEATHASRVVDATFLRLSIVVGHDHWFHRRLGQQILVGYCIASLFCHDSPLPISTSCRNSWLVLVLLNLNGVLRCLCLHSLTLCRWIGPTWVYVIINVDFLSWCLDIMTLSWIEIEGKRMLLRHLIFGIQLLHNLGCNLISQSLNFLQITVHIQIWYQFLLDKGIFKDILGLLFLPLLSNLSEVDIAKWSWQLLNSCLSTRLRRGWRLWLLCFYGSLWTL